MTANEAIAQIEAWCEQSTGSLIEIAPGVEYGFTSVKKYLPTDIAVIEATLGCTLPPSYHEFLVAVGQSRLFIDDSGLGLFLFSPEEVISASQYICYEEDETGTDKFCFIGEHRIMGDYFGFVTNRAKTKNFDVFCHEYPPGEYAVTSDELKSWRTFDAWLVQLVESFGRESL